MGLRFIFMLTRNDRTVMDASQHLQTALSMGVRHIGFKDIGLPIEQLKALNQTIHAHGMTSYLEVVSLDRDSEIASATAAVDIGVDVLLGGTRADDVLPILRGSGIRYFPFPGQISGHPSVLEGTIEDIVQSAKAMAARDGVHGLDLLAYRSREAVPDLMRAVCRATSKPVLVAGSIDTPERIAVVNEAGAAGFTIGTAALDGKYLTDTPDVQSQLAAVIRDVAELNKHLSPIHKKTLTNGFAVASLPRPALDAGPIHPMQLKLTRLEGESAWSFREREDELYFVHRGRLLMKLRDRDEVIEESEFIVIPHGVERRLVALEETCEILLIGQAATPSEYDT